MEGKMGKDGGRERLRRGNGKSKERGRKRGKQWRRKRVNGTAGNQERMKNLRLEVMMDDREDDGGI